MTISERIFELLEQRGMSQKEFSEKTGIAQSSISDWKRKKANQNWCTGTKIRAYFPENGSQHRVQIMEFKVVSNKL